MRADVYGCALMCVDVQLYRCALMRIDVYWLGVICVDEGARVLIVLDVFPCAVMYFDVLAYADEY